MTGEHEPTVIEQMAIDRQNALAADWGAREWFQLATTEEREASVRAMLAAVRELRDLLDHEGGNPSLLPGTNANQAYDASNVIERIILEHERRAGGKGE